VNHWVVKKRTRVVADRAAHGGVSRRGDRIAVALGAIAAVLGAFAVGLLAAGCAADPSEGYAWGDAYRDEVGSIAVPIFENQTFARDLGLDLAEAVLKQVQFRTPWEPAPRSRAQTVLNGAVTGFELRQLARDRNTGLVAELAVVLTVSFEWIDSRTGEVLVSRRRLVVGESFVPAQAAGEPLEAGRAAAVEEAAREIVEALRSSW
jgi:hypothetical protein